MITVHLHAGFDLPGALPHVEWWMIGVTASIVLSIAYLAISATIGRGLRRSGQALANPLGLATSAIFFSCGVGHGLHAFHALEPALGIAGEVGPAARVVYADWHVWTWEFVTAGVALTYWSLRKRFPILIRGTSLFEDLRQRQQEALDIHDSVVQRLAQAKLNFELGREKEGMRDLEETLAASRAIITKFLGEHEPDEWSSGAATRRQTPVEPLR